MKIKNRDKKRYTYVAKVNRVVDGDTFDCKVDLGFEITIKQRFRLRNIDTPEVRGEEREDGLRVKEHVKDLIENKEVLVETFKLGKYGRYVVEIYVPTDGGLLELSSHLLEEGMGREFMKIESKVAKKFSLEG